MNSEEGGAGAGQTRFQGSLAPVRDPVSHHLGALLQLRGGFIQGRLHNLGFAAVINNDQLIVTQLLGLHTGQGAGEKNGAIAGTHNHTN